MSPQEIFNKVAAHLLKQSAKSYKWGACRYRGSGNLRCAVGCLIDNKLYDESLENHNSDHPVVRDVLLKSGVPQTSITCSLLRDLQITHDAFDVALWKEELRNIAKNYCLSADILNLENDDDEK